MFSMSARRTMLSPSSPSSSIRKGMTVGRGRRAYGVCCCCCCDCDCSSSVTATDLPPRAGATTTAEPTAVESPPVLPLVLVVTGAIVPPPCFVRRDEQGVVIAEAVAVEVPSAEFVLVGVDVDLLRMTVRPSFRSRARRLLYQVRTLSIDLPNSVAIISITSRDGNLFFA